VNEISQQLNRLKDAWLSQPGIPENLSVIGHASISREDMADAMTAMSLLADLLARDDNKNLYMTTEYACAAPLKNAHGYVTKHVNGDQATHLLGFIAFLQQIQAILIDAIVQSSQAGVQAAAKPLTEKLTNRFEPLEPSARAYNMSLGMAFAKAGHID